MHTYLEKRDPRRNLARFYRMAVLPNLSGAGPPHRAGGRIGPGAQTRLEWFDSEIEATSALEALETAKRRRGYFVEPQQLLLF